MARFGLACTALAALALFGFRVPTAAAADHVTVTTDFPPVPMHAALYIAETKGWFKDAGVEVEIKDGRGSSNTIQLVGAGQVDIGYVELGPVMPAREAGIPVISIAAYTRQGDLGLAYDAKLGAVTPKDFVGKTLLCFAGSYWQPFIKPFFTAAGVDMKDVHVLNVDVAAMWSSYMAGQADGVLSTPPYGLPLVADKRPSRAIMAQEYGVVLPGYGLVVRNSEAKSRAAVYAKVAKATARGWQYLLDGHEDEGVAAIQKLRPDAKLNPAMAVGVIKGFEKLVYTEATKGKPMGWQAEKDWATWIKTGEAANYVKPGHKPAEFYTNALIEAK